MASAAQAESRVAEFWSRCRGAVPGLPDAVPEAWPFGATPAHADELLGLVLAGIKTGTASSLWDYETTGDPLPEVGDYSIILDGVGDPRAVIRTTALATVPFAEVSAEHAHSEGEGDRTLDDWRATHERYWRTYSESPRGFAPDMPILCERFELVWAPAGPRG
ncbi:ASCH domain-containing protein [Leucobacter chromiireducens]|uniref:ASCH domain-containing protein n=1 Tax=Leucobacter chromiireducens TaxID=283877 RepID=UPI000F63D13B|nr:ASCH domain-containing protein [Leucobacter chromiireducens]